MSWPPVDPKLDALMAEKIMKWESMPMAGNYGSKKWWHLSKNGRDLWTHRLGRWSPSTNIDHAWEVVEQMIAGPLGWDFGCGKTGLLWGATFTARTRSLRHQETAQTAPLAICRAALQAVAEVDTDVNEETQCPRPRSRNEKKR